jgi:hypothetical protein
VPGLLTVGERRECPAAPSHTPGAVATRGSWARAHGEREQGRIGYHRADPGGFTGVEAQGLGTAGYEGWGGTREGFDGRRGMMEYTWNRHLHEQGKDHSRGSHDVVGEYGERVVGETWARLGARLRLRACRGAATARRQGRS